MNFLIFRDFFGNFSDFYEFIWIYFEFKRIRNQIISRADMENDVARVNMASPRGAHVCVHTCVHTCVRMCVCVHVCASIIREIKLPFQDNAISLNHL